MSKKIFITATGTDIGKTYVSALIVKTMRENNFNCGYFKPVLSGVILENDKLKISDCNYVIDKSNLKENPENCVGYFWEEAVSPHLAAKRQNQKIEITKIKQKYNELLKKYDYLLIEGAGGITCPLILEESQKYLLKDLIKELNTSIIIVADGGLGTINSVLLTVEYAKQNHINIQGIVLNNYEPNNFMHQDNLKQIEFLTNIKVIATVERNQGNIKLLEKYFKD